MRLIDADALGKRITKRLRKKGSFEGKDITELGYTILCIHEAETVDAEPIRHGHWEFHAASIKDAPTEACSICGEWSYGYCKRYCPHCGAKMDEVEEDE